MIERRSRWFTLFSMIVVVATVTPPMIPSHADEVTDNQAKPRDPVSIALIQMDLSGAQRVLEKHDLDDDGSLNKTEWKRLSWTDDETRRFDLNRSGDLQQLEIALKLADRRVDDGIVQMDSTLVDRYMGQYDVNRDGKLTFDELADNSFTDQLGMYDKNSDGEVSTAELIRGLAWERQFRTELGIKGCDQGGAMKLINRGDANGDKRIDETELQKAGLSADAMDFDRNDDGKLSVSELAERLAERRRRFGLNPTDQFKVRGLLRNFDRDNDGIIAASEMPAEAAKSIREQCDRNGDGNVTEIELEKHFGEERKKLEYDDEDAKRAGVLIQRNDADRSKSLSRAEMVASGSDRSSPLSPVNLPVIDDNSDGKIDLHELARYLKKTRGRSGT